MVVEYALPAVLPGALVALHYGVQMSRPRWGYGSDVGGRRTPWIIGGMAVLAIGGLLAAIGTALMAIHFWPAILLSVFAFIMIGIGVGASGTSLLTLLATRVSARRRPAAASIVWIMMIAGFVITSIFAGINLDPYSGSRLVMVSYSAQDLILEPFAGLVFGFTPGESTKLSGVQNGGVMAGMILVAVAGSAIGGKRFGSMRFWAVGGCLASAVAFVGLSFAAYSSETWPLRENVFFLGFANGAFAVAAIGSMMGLANTGEAERQGTRMGLWGASQAIAFGLGGFLGTVAVDVARSVFGSR